MIQTFGFAFLALTLLIVNCTGASEDRYAELASPIPEVRSQTRRQLLLSDSGKLCDDVKQLILSGEVRDKVSEAALLLLRDKSESLPARLLAVASRVPSARVRAALLSTVNLNLKNAEDVEKVDSLLKDTNLIVRLAAANLLKNQNRYRETVIAIGVQSLSSDEAEWLGDPPRPAVIIGKQLLVSISNRKAVLASLRKQTSSVQRVQCHLRDLVAY